MDEYIAVCLYDIKRAIDEMDSFFADYPTRYDVFERISYAEALLRERLK